MRYKRALWCAWLMTAPCCAAASLDFAVSANIASLYNRFGVDPQGNILIAANPESCTLPTVNPLYTCGPIWVAKLDASGQKLLFATYLGNGPTIAYTAVAGVAADASGSVIVAAHTVAEGLPQSTQSRPRLSRSSPACISRSSPPTARTCFMGPISAVAEHRAPFRWQWTRPARHISPPPRHPLTFRPRRSRRTTKR